MDAGFVKPPTVFLIIIRGLGFWGEGVVPIFSENHQQPFRRFSGILSSRPSHFFKSSAIDPEIFRNPQLASRSFFQIFSNRSGDFPEFSARVPLILLNHQKSICFF